MQFYRRIIFFISLGMIVGACAAPTYIDPLIDAADDSEIAILKGGSISRISDAYGKDIPVVSSEPHPTGAGNYHFDEFRLPPGEYDIWYGYRHYKIGLISDFSHVTLKAGHVYTVENEACYGWFCSRMDRYTADIWLVDITTGEWIGGCRQEMGCVREQVGQRQDTAELEAKAQCGDTHAQSDLGYRYITGRGVAQDLARAYFWFGIAHTGGVGIPPKERQTLSGRITPEQIAEGERLIAEWEPKDCTAEEIVSPSD